LVSIFFGVLIADAVLHKINRTPQRTYEACEHGDLSHCKTLPGGSSVPGGGDDAESHDEKSYRDEYRSEKDLSAQQQMAWWAFGMMILTGVGVVLLYQTLSATSASVDQMQDANRAAWTAVEISADLGERQIQIAERAADEQREVAQTAHAAFLVPTGIIPEIWFSDLEKLRVTFRNIGQSPAYNIRFSAKSYSHHASDFFRPQIISSLTTFNNFLPQLETDSFWLGFDREKLLSGNPNVVEVGVYGVILWDDIFGNARGIRFNYETNIPPIGPINKFTNDWFGNHILKRWQVQKIDGLCVGQTFDLDLEEDEDD